MKLILGIGNPDEQYQNTRHNVGWLLLDYIAKKSEANDFAFDKKLNAETSKTRLQVAGKKQPVVLAKSHSYVNATGPVLAKLAKHIKAKPDDIIVIQDDMDVPFGTFKMSYDKNSGGHKGVESIFKALKTKKFYRLRLGTHNRGLEKANDLSTKKKESYVIDFVLGKFTPKEHEELKKLFKSAVEFLADKTWIRKN